MRHRRPPILNNIEALRANLAAQKWRCMRLSNPLQRQKKLNTTEEMLRKIDNIEQWVRTRMTEEEWKGYIQ